MRAIKIWVIIITAAFMALWGINDIYARGGGRGGGFHGGGGGWSGGRGGESRGGGDRGNWDRGEARGGDWGGQAERNVANRPERGDHGDHRHDNNNNNNNTTNNYGGNTVNVNGYGWGDNAVAGLVVGTALGAVAVGAAQPETVVVEQPVQTIVQQGPAIGTELAALPAGSTATNVGGTLYYQNNNIWYRPYFGGSGVYYQVVQPPSGN